MSKRSATTRSRDSSNSQQNGNKKAKGGSGGDRSKKSLDFLFEGGHNNESLLQGYTPDQLKELQERLKDIQTDVIRTLDYDNEIREVIGAKLDGKSMWFCVRWIGGETTFIPANILNRIAPNKVIEYYESIVQFAPQIEPNEVRVKEEVIGVGNLNDRIISAGRNEPMVDTRVSNILKRREILDRPVMLREDRERNRALEQERQKVQTNNTPSNANNNYNNNNNNNNINNNNSNSNTPSNDRPPMPKNTQVGPVVHKIMHCTGCGIKLKFPAGTRLIKCPSCHHIMETAHI
jgi:LSD1 subclass zinc finger protein